MLASFARDEANTNTADANAPALLAAPSVAPPMPKSRGSIAVDAGPRVSVPSFSGADLRKVVETAASLGLRVEPVGSGVEREQFPAAGTQVPVGTNVVVRFSR